MTLRHASTDSRVRRWLLWLLLAIFAGVLFRHSGDVRQLGGTLARGRWPWVLLGAALLMVYYLLCAAVYACAFRTVGVRSRLAGLLPVWFASIFVNVTVPTAGPLIFVDDAALRGESAARATAGMILVRVADFGTFLWILVGGLAYLQARHDLRVYQVATALALLAIVAGWTALLLLGGRRRAMLRLLLAGFQAKVNQTARRCGRPSPLPGDWAERNAVQFSQASMAAAQRPGDLLVTGAVALAAHLVALASLQVFFMAFRVVVPLPTLVAGFSIGLLFWIVSILPEGIGVVEPLMVLVFTRLGVPKHGAILAVVAFRGLSFWLPLLIGVFVLPHVRSFGAGRVGGRESAGSSRTRRSSRPSVASGGTPRDPAG